MLTCTRGQDNHPRLAVQRREQVPSGVFQVPWDHSRGRWGVPEQPGPLGRPRSMANKGGEAHQAVRQRHVQSSTRERFDRGNCTIRWRRPWILRIRTPREQHLAIGAPPGREG